LTDRVFDILGGGVIFHLVPFDNLGVSHRPKALGLLLIVSVKVIETIQLLVGVSGT